jgi:glyoxylase-like metal-dependent hydrolase (beta-lactamase superfamily II)
MSDTWAEVADRVYVRRHRSMDLNVSLIVGDGACLVVDTRATEREARDLVDAIRTVTPHPWAVVNTHHHFDHTFGNSIFRPAEIWGHRRAAEQLVEDGERMRAGTAARYGEAGLDEMAADIEASAIDPPDQLVDDLSTLSVGGRPVQLRYLGRGHTDNDLVLTAPDAGLVIAGDLVEEGAPPQFGSAYPLEWPLTLDAVAELVTDRLVPGHGAVVDREFVWAQRTEHAELVARAREGYADGRPAAEVAKQLPYFGDCALDGVERTYLQLQ